MVDVIFVIETHNSYDDVVGITEMVVMTNTAVAAVVFRTLNISSQLVIFCANQSLVGHQHQYQQHSYALNH